MNVPSANIPNRSRSGHGRVASTDERRRVAVPRKSTKGPLEADVDDPLAESHPSLSVAATSSPRRVLSPSPTITSPLSPDSGQGGGTPTLSDLPAKDFSFLLDPAAYHALLGNSVPQPFLAAPSQPSVTDPLPDLLSSGHFRLAATVAARTLSSSVSANDAATIFHLFHTRLACLCLINEHALAAQESKLLGDLTSAFYRHPITNAHLVPWDLRVLAVRLMALGYGDWRKGIMGYYELAREARESVAASSTPEEKALWRARLRECGIRVANALVEMGELESAGRHLSTLVSPSTASDSRAQETREVLVMETMVWLRLGDIRAAKRCLATAGTISSSSIDTEKVDGTLEALLKIAEADYSGASESWKALHTTYPADAMISQNLAVCLLYTGRISDARDLLTDLTGSSEPFHAMVFNLCTIYELCTERSRERKVGLAERLAGRESGTNEMGWELGNADFKL